MAEAITEIVEMTMESDVMQTNARDRAERLFSVKSMVDAHETLYAQLLR
jgi:hypothetical protein